MNARLMVLMFLTWAVLTHALPAKKDQRLETGQKEVKKTEDHDGKDKKPDGAGEDYEDNKDEGDGDEEEDDEEDDDDDDDDAEEDEEENGEKMTKCLAQENVTEDEMKNFLTSKNVENVGEALKKAILCFVKSIEFFNGKDWNLRKMADVIGEKTKTFQTIKGCLKKVDDAKLNPHERTYRVQKCVIEESGKAGRPNDRQ